MTLIEKTADLEAQFERLPLSARDYFTAEGLCPETFRNSAFIEDYKYHMKNLRNLFKDDRDYLDSTDYLAVILGGLDE